jgi:general secretion pathway protein H
MPCSLREDKSVMLSPLTDKASQSGFTLLEILVVIMLIAISAAMIAPSFISMSDADVSEEARRLQQLLRLASEEAQLTGTPIRLTALKRHYYLESLAGDKQWQKLSEAPFNSYALPANITISAIQFSGGFSRQSESEEEGDADDKDEEKELVGRIIFWPDGMLDAADLTMQSSSETGELLLQLRPGPGGIRVAEDDPS